MAVEDIAEEVVIVEGVIIPVDAMHLKPQKREAIMRTIRKNLKQKRNPDEVTEAGEEDDIVVGAEVEAVDVGADHTIVDAPVAKDLVMNTHHKTRAVVMKQMKIQKEKNKVVVFVAVVTVEDQGDTEDVQGAHLHRALGMREKNPSEMMRKRTTVARNHQDVRDIHVTEDANVNQRAKTARENHRKHLIRSPMKLPRNESSNSKYKLEKIARFN